MEVRKLFKDTEESQDEYLKLKGYFYGWDELVKYYVGLTSEKGTKILEKFDSLKINYNRPYTVIGSKDILRAFAAYYIRTMGTVRRGFVKYNLKEYAFRFDSENDFGGDDVMFLLSPRYDTYYGNTMKTLETNVMHDIGRRMDNNQITILLLENIIPEFTNKSDLKVIDLTKLFNTSSTTAIINNVSSIASDSSDLVSELLNRYPDLNEISNDERVPNLKFLRSGDFERAYNNIRKIRDAK